VSIQNLDVKPGERIAGASGVALIDDFATAVFRYGHRQGIKLLYLLIAATLFCMVLLPLAFRESVLRPLGRLLGGVKRVERGDLGAVVNIQTEDEIGALAQHFNHMTHTLRKAEHQLRDYAATLEEKVEARTAALTQSLEELKAAQARLVQAEKMASLGALTAGIAHEIKNPLNFVNNFAALSIELVEELRAELDALNGQLDVKHRAELEDLLADLRLNTQKINQHGQRADGIVQAMLLHSRGAEGERRAVDLNALVEEYIRLSYHGKRAQMPAFNATIEKDLDARIGQVDLIPQDMGRVLLNLLGNAFDAMADQVAQVSGPYAPTVTVSTRQVGTQVEIRIADNGPGIPAAVREKIFEPFFTTKPTGSGTGLGLSLSYDIVTQGHGGTLTVESDEGQGAAFVVTLPTASMQS
jgi:signal transduction histidine kinase